MAKITVGSKGQYPDLLYAASLFIDEVTENQGIYVKLIFTDGSIENQEITSGSKFLTGGGAKIEKVIFVNPSILSADVEYHFSTLASYDEAKVIGNVNAVSKKYIYTKDDITFASSSFVGGSGFYSGYILENPAGSGVNTVVDKVNGHAKVGSYILGAAIGDVTVLYGVGIISSTPAPSKLVDSAGITYSQSKVHIYISVGVPPYPSLAGTYHTEALVLSGATVNHGLSMDDSPIILTPGTFVAFQSAAVNAEGLMNFQWREELIV